jgi:hypothetical protein
MTPPRTVAFLLLVAAAWAGLWLSACGTSKSTESRDASAEAGDARADAADATGVGVITFSQAPDGGGTFYAAFTETPPPAAPNCSSVDAGACTTTSCSAPAASDSGAGSDGGDDSAAPVVSRNPGTLKVTGGVFGSGFQVAPDVLGTYLYTTPGTLFTAGETLGVAAGGGALPAFSLRTVAAPPVLDLTEPTTDGGKLAVATGQPLTLTWMPGRAGDETVVTATAYFTSGGLASMTCTWPAAEGGATVPSAALRPLAAQNAIGSGIVWYELAQTKFTTGTVEVSMSAYVPRGALATFQ